MTKTALTGAAADAISHTVEPPETVSDLLQKSTGQVVDFHGFLLHEGEQGTQKGKSLVTLIIADGASKTIPFNFWEEKISMIPKEAAKKVWYVYGAYLTMEKSGGMHVTARKTTFIVVAEDAWPTAAALLSTNIRAKTIDDADLKSVSSMPDKDYKTCPAEDS